MLISAGAGADMAYCLVAAAMQRPLLFPTMNNFPKAAAAILDLPGVQSLEREPDGWCCHLHHGWTTAALGGSGTIIDASLATIRAFVKGAYQLPPAPAPAPASLSLPNLPAKASKQLAEPPAVFVALSEDQARIAHAALCAAAAIARAKQSKMLDLHEAQAVSAPVTSQEAWKTFLAWQAKEDALATVAETIRHSGVELHFNSFGLCA